MYDVNFEHYKVFYHVAKFGNITSAAHSLYLSQPSVSRCISTLEEELGCKLFTRSKKGVELTAEGQQLYKHVRIACKHLLSAEEELSLMKNETSGILRLAISDAAFQQRIISRISAFHAKYPSVHLKIDNMSTPETIEAIHTNVVDMAIVTTPFASPYELTVRSLCTLQDIAVAGSAFSDLKERVLSLEELNGYTLITLEEGSTTRHFFNRLFRQYGIPLNPDIELASISQVLPLVRSNLGIGFVPLRIAEEDLRSERVFRIKLKEEIPPRNISLITDDEYETNDIMIAFTEMLTDPEINPPLDDSLENIG
jgi:DNA-binding transcriptional LysR family regulator